VSAGPRDLPFGVFVDALDRTARFIGLAPPTTTSASRADLGQPISYVVIGNSGYHDLQRLGAGAHHRDEVVPGVTLEYGEDPPKVVDGPQARHRQIR
jgi:hypothetical protein